MQVRRRRSLTGVAKTWAEMSTGQKRAICVVGAIESVLTGAAMMDLARRPTHEVRGPKAAWALAAFVQPVGPIAYFAVGRR